MEHLHWAFLLQILVFLLPKKNLLMERNVRLVLLMGIFFKPCLQHNFLLVQNFAKMGKIKVNKGNILSQYSLF
jgi:hypothetical protein